MKKYLSSLTLSILLVIALTGYVYAAFPDRPITLVVNYSAGGTADLSSRALAKSAEKFLGQPIAVVNRPGASGTVGVSVLAASRPDGYTIGVFTAGPLTMSPHIVDVPYDPVKDLEFIMGYGRYMYGLCARSDAPFKILKDLVQYAKANPGKIKYSTAGVATPENFAMTQLAKENNVKWEAVIFKETPACVTACLGGHTDVVALNPANLAPFIKAGRLQLLASFTHDRWDSAPDVPTVYEQGFKFSVPTSTLAVGVPKGVPKPILDKLREAFKKSMNDPEFLAIMKKFYVTPVYDTPEDYRKKMEEYSKVFEGILKELGLHKSQQKKK